MKRVQVRSLGLDVLRAGCVLGVLVTHFAPFFIPADGAGGTVRNALALGSFGVTGFFLLSAYLLTGILLKEVQAKRAQIWKRYWIRRSLRIWPLYFLAIAVFVVAALLFSKPLTGLPWLATFTYNWASWHEHNAVLSHFWSMCVEEQLYVLVPILAFVPLRRRIPVLVVLIVAAPIARWLVSFNAPYPAVWNFTTSHLDVFALGVLLASLDFAGSPRWKRFRASIAGSPWVGITVAALFALLVVLAAIDPQRVFGGGDSAWTYLLAAAVWAWCLVVLTKRQLVSTSPAVRAAAWMGQRSYGIYVYHWPVVLLGLTFGPATGIPLPVLGLGLIAVVLVVSEASYRWFESPFLRLKARFSTDRPLVGN